MTTYIKKTTNITFLTSAILLCATLMFNMNISRIPIILFFASAIIDILINKRYKNVKLHKSSPLFIAMIIFYSLAWIWHPFEQSSINIFNREVENRLPFLAFGIIGLIGAHSQKLNIKYIAATMIITSLATITFTLYQIFSTTTPVSYLHYIWLLKQCRPVSHMIFNLYLNSTIIFAIYAITNTKNIKIKAIYITSIIPIITMLLTSEGRTGTLSTLVILTIFIIHKIYTWKKWMIIPALFITICLAIAAIQLNPKPKTSLEQNPRIQIWKNAINTIAEKPILGYGISDGRVAFVENGLNNEGFQNSYYLKGIKDTFDGKKRTKHLMHPHNAFLNTTIDFGIVGLLVLLFIFIYPIITPLNSNRLFTFAFISAFTIQALFESFAPWAASPLLFCFLLSIWTKGNPTQ